MRVGDVRELPLPDACLDGYVSGGVIEHFWNAESKQFEYRDDDEIMRGSLITRDGQIVHEKFKG